MSILLKAFVVVIILGVGVVSVLILWEPSMTHRIGQGSSLKLQLQNEWMVTTSSPSGEYWPLSAFSEKLGLNLAIRSGRLFTKRTNESEWSYYTEIIYGEEFSLGSAGEILMDGEMIAPKEKTSLPLDELYKFEPASSLNQITRP
ncbi:MAG: hypothetical protein NWT02_00480 [Opitutales bacterium]|jgi:hypothetical protein|nr:hypothetical protein [Opitutales bacterium]MDP4643285.1 hypothetical protein [Opitutales bacterium]MDP4777679.1 hypothetical protein [Opitutales bacterium]MDP5078923.1 hypothetical protein [Opitutales bacterium]